MGVGADLYRVRTDFDFRRPWRIMLAVSSILLIVVVASLATRGLNLSIDFRGGAVWEVPSSSMTAKQAEDVLTEFDKADGAKIQVVTDANDRRIIRVQAEKANSIDESDSIAAALADAATEAAGEDGDAVEVTDIAQNTVGPSWGESLTRDAVRALVVFFIVIALYMSWQLEWRMALSALLAVVHDVAITVGFYSVFGFEVTPATVISVLTILGFSLYDTIVVYDRVHENAQRYDRSGKYTYSAIMRRSLNQVLMRSLNTTFVAILPVVAILVIGGLAYGQQTMMDFSLALVVGLVAGVYSSIAIASPMVVWLKEREPRYRRIRERARERGLEAEADWIPMANDSVAPTGSVVAGATSVSLGSASTATSSVASKAAQYQRPTPPRPRKQGKKR